MSVVGARPQFIKAAPLCRALRAQHEEVLVHSGQHYDHSMSEVFFQELGIPKPDYNLGVGSGGHGSQTGEMLGMLETLMIEQGPDVVVVYGDTNTTLAGGLAAAKLNIPVVHVEAGLRSFNRKMPEEVNRVLVDHISTLLLCPTSVARDNLGKEGISEGVHVVGDVMLDTARSFAERVDVGEALESHGVEAGEYYFATVHRAATSDDPEKLAQIVHAFGRLDKPVIWSVHPRTAQNLDRFDLTSVVDDYQNILRVPPVPYTEAIGLIQGAAALLTDSGGMQKEAYFLMVPCVTLREETEWVETVEHGWNCLVGTDPDAIVSAVSSLEVPNEHPDVYGDGHAAERIVELIGRIES